MRSSLLRLTLSVFLVAAPAAASCHSGERSVPINNSSGVPVPVEDAAGFWLVKPIAGKGECLVSLNRLPRGDAYGVHLEACSLALLDEVASWRPVDGGFELLDSDGDIVIRFRRTGVDSFETSDERYLLERVPLV